MIQLPVPCFSLDRMDDVKIHFLFWLVGTATSFAFRLLELETTLQSEMPSTSLTTDLLTVLSVHSVSRGGHVHTISASPPVISFYSRG